MAEPNVVAAIPSTTLKAHLVTRLREGIMGGHFRPGERLNESKLARQFGVSRIPVREALVQLQEQGLVMNHPRRGMFVNALSPEDTQKINSLRIVLEAEAMKLCRARFTSDMNANLSAIMDAMERWENDSELDAAALDLEFHRTIWQYGGNPYLVRTLDSLAPMAIAHHALASISQHHIIKRSLAHHRALLEVVQGASAMSPEAVMVAHLNIAYSEPERYSSFALSKK